ncbi:MAG: hypothetical protein Q9163_000927 [Psora crenata]
MSSFFTTPASQKKRKREDADRASSKRRITTKSTSGKPQRPKPGRDESISGSESDDDEAGTRHTGEYEARSEESSEDETAAERRLRLAEQYLENIKGEVQEEVGFDAAEIDRDLISQRLQEDVAETKGKLFKHIASTLDFPNATTTRFRMKTLSTTGIAVCPPYAYTVSKDIVLIKWKLPVPLPAPEFQKKVRKRSPRPSRRRPTKLLTVKGSRSHATEKDYMHHTGPILCIVASSTGKFVATGGLDKKIIVYDATDLKPLRVFPHHRDAVTSLSFRRDTNQLFSASKDRTVKVWSLDELAYVETLFGHQDEVIDLAAYPGVERCVSVGARDRTARVWKVVEETQLVFRGGGGEKRRPLQQQQQQQPKNNMIRAEEPYSYAEGSIDRVALIDNETFITGSDNGSLCLWSLHKKKPIFTYPLAHGLNAALKPEEASAEMHLGPDFKVPKPQPKWITALASVPFSDLVLSGSSDGLVRAWRVGEGKKTIEAVGVVGEVGSAGQDGEEEVAIRGIINDLEVFQRGGRGVETLCIVAAVGTEHKLGRWTKVQGRSGAVILEVPRKLVHEDHRPKAGEVLDAQGEGGAVQLTKIDIVRAR